MQIRGAKIVLIYVVITAVGFLAGCAARKKMAVRPLVIAPRVVMEFRGVHPDGSCVVQAVALDAATGAQVIFCKQ